jgi:putative hydrolase of the HAD superfamily
MKFKAILFDLFGTLIDDFAASTGQMHTEMAAVLAVPYERFIPLWGKTTEMRIIGAFDTVEANIEYVLDAISFRAQPDQISKAVEIRMKYITRALQPRPGAIDTLNELKHHGYELGLLSNCSIEIPMIWHATAFADLIDKPIFSSIERLRKPDERIYHLACDRLGITPESCLYIADGEDHELAAAAKVGLHPVLIRASSQETSRRSHQEAREWLGLTISTLPEVLRLVGVKTIEL